MTKVINLIGASGTGKTTIAKLLEKEGHNIIHSYTTRKPRRKDEWGHRFIDDDWKYCVISKMIYRNNKNEDTIGKPIAYEQLYDHHYFATDEQVERGKTNIYVVTPNGAEQVKNFYKDSEVEVISIYLAADKVIRRKRMIERSIPTPSQFRTQFRSGKTYIHQELLKKVSERLYKDDKIFKIIKADYTVDANGTIEDVFESVTNILEE